MQQIMTEPTDRVVTLIGETIDEVMTQFRQRGLAEAGYVIIGPAVRQQFSRGEESLFAGAALVAATFARRA
ncbi:MAG: hypothetical protein EOP19_07875 [Hyphomicrobiales bacterium]|nr:MAG: hypothetical protein EOP19_07875 [Hyphomicrobiales bacterium]